MAIAALKIKIMPESVETDLEAMKEKIEKIASCLDRVKVHSFEIEEIAFGLRALIVIFAWPEELDQEQIESKLNELEGISSVQVIDFRRSIG